MSQADSIDRRSILAAAGGIAAAGALAPMALASPVAANASPEFREWYRLALTFPAVCREQEAWEEAHPDADHASSPDGVCTDALKIHEDAIFARPVSSWNDVAEIAMIPLFWAEKEMRPGDDGRDPCCWSLDHCRVVDNDDGRNTRSEGYLFHAASKIAFEMFGGANV